MLSSQLSWLLLYTCLWSTIIGTEGAFWERCEEELPRLSAEQIHAGALPYLFGGNRLCEGSESMRSQPGCKEDTNYTRFCEASLPYDWRLTYLSRSEYWKMNLVGSLENCPKHLIRSFVNKLIKLDRWQTLQLTPCDLFSQIRGKTLWLLGDSMMLDFMKAIECFLRPFWAEPDWEQARLRTRFPEGSSMPTCLDLESASRLCFLRINKGDSMLHEGLPFLLREANHTDIAILNFGLHGWWMEDIRIVASFLEIYRSSLPTIFWKDMSPHHKPHVYNTSDSHEHLVCRPLLDAQQQARDQPFATAIWFNDLTIPVFKEAAVNVIQDEEVLRPFWRHHRQGECLHFCQPSAPQVWISSLSQGLQDLAAAS